MTVYREGKSYRKRFHSLLCSTDDLPKQPCLFCVNPVPISFMTDSSHLILAPSQFHSQIQLLQNVAHIVNRSFTSTAALPGPPSQSINIFLSLVGSRHQHLVGWWKVGVFTTRWVFKSWANLQRTVLPHAHPMHTFPACTGALSKISFLAKPQSTFNY